jgi:hypothetical protein
LIRLLPNRELPEPAPAEGGPNDPRTIMWENYKRQRDRGALHGGGYDGLKLENERLKAELAALKAGAPAPDEPGASGGANAPFGGANAPAGNVVPLTRPPATSTPAPAAPPPAAPRTWDETDNGRKWHAWRDAGGFVHDY